MESLTDVQNQLKQAKHQPYCWTKNPAEGIAKWCEQLEITDIYYQEEWTKEEADREKEVKAILPDAFTSILTTTNSYFTPKMYR